MGKIRLEIKSYPSSHSAKINFNLPSPTDNIKVNPPPPHLLLPPRIGSLIPNLRVGCLPQALKVLQMTLQRMCSLHRNHLTLILKLCRLHTSYKILHLPEHPWQHFHVRGRRTRVVTSALLPLILRPCCFKYIFSWLFRKRFHICFIFQEILDGREFFFLTLFFAFSSKNSKSST